MSKDMQYISLAAESVGQQETPSFNNSKVRVRFNSFQLNHKESVLKSPDQKFNRRTTLANVFGGDKKNLLLTKEATKVIIRHRSMSGLYD